MGDDRRELLCLPFVASAERVETAHDAAIVGQLREPAAVDHGRAAERPQAACRKMAVLADAAAVIAGAVDRNGKAR